LEVALAVEAFLHELYVTMIDAVIPAPNFECNAVWDEKDVLECLVAWKARREKIQKARNARGYPPAKFQKFSLDNAFARTRCVGCKEKGHINKVCAKRKEHLAKLGTQGANLVELEDVQMVGAVEETCVCGKGLRRLRRGFMCCDGCQDPPIDGGYWRRACAAPSQNQINQELRPHRPADAALVLQGSGVGTGSIPVECTAGGRVW
jgi:hypothetical protein